MSKINSEALDILFRAARTHSSWQPRPVEDALLRELYDVAKWGPTSANTQPMRLVWVKSAAAKERLKPALMPGNVEKTMTAPVTVIIAGDQRFYEHMPRLIPPLASMANMFNKPEQAEAARAFAKQNSTLQAAYLILAARALGLDAGPMGGFDASKVDAEFFPDGRYHSNLLINFGYGIPEKVFPRNPRLEFDEVSQIL